MAKEKMKIKTNWLRNYRDETVVVKPTDEKQAKLLARRRRIEDVQEGLRLDREAFKELWDD